MRAVKIIQIFWRIRRDFSIFTRAGLLHLPRHEISMAEKPKNIYDESKIKPPGAGLMA